MGLLAVRVEDVSDSVSWFLKPIPPAGLTQPVLVKGGMPGLIVAWYTMACWFYKMATCIWRKTGGMNWGNRGGGWGQGRGGGGKPLALKTQKYLNKY